MKEHNRRKFLKLSAGALAAPMLTRPVIAQTAWPAARPSGLSSTYRPANACCA